MGTTLLRRSAAWRLAFLTLFLLAAPVTWAQTDDEASPAGDASVVPPYDEDSEGDMALLLQDLAAECRARETRGEDYTEQLHMMNGLVYKGELVARNYAEFLEDFLPKITDADLQAESMANLSHAYLRIQESDQSDRVMEALIAKYPDPATEWGKNSRYIQAINDVQLDRYDSAVRRLEELWGVADQFDEKSFRRIGMQLAEMLYRKEDWEGVLRVGLAAVPPEIDENGVSAFIYEKIALTYQNLGEFENARLYFQRILDFLQDLKSRDPDHRLLDGRLLASAERGLRQAGMGLQTAEYRRQNEENRIEGALGSALIGSAVEGMMKNMDKPTNNLEPKAITPVHVTVPAPPKVDEGAHPAYAGTLLCALLVLLIGGVVAVAVLRYRRQIQH